MASIRKRTRAGGSIAYGVLYVHEGQQTSATFDDEKEAEQFREAVDTLGAAKAMKAWDVTPTKRATKRSTAPTVEQWLRKYIDSRTGVTKATLYDYNSYLRLDIADTLGKIPLDLLTRDDVAGWVQTLQDRKLSGKTVANRHGFLSAALKVAVAERVIDFNPAASTRLPRTEKKDRQYLDEDEYDLLKSCFTERWRPMLDFMVASGLRLGELTALKPSDVDRKRGTVRIQRGWKRTYDSAKWELGATKTERSDRTISVPQNVLENLVYTGEYLFTNSSGGPIRSTSWRNNVWYPSLEKARKKGLAKKPRIHDMRHTCASWMVQDGESLAVVQAHLGHESINTTIGMYTHLDRKSADAAASNMGKRFGK